jgi:hypothetical protein
MSDSPDEANSKDRKYYLVFRVVFRIWAMSGVLEEKSVDDTILRYPGCQESGRACILPTLGTQMRVARIVDAHQ